MAKLEDIEKAWRESLSPEQRAELEAFDHSNRAERIPTTAFDEGVHSTLRAGARSLSDVQRIHAPPAGRRPALRKGTSLETFDEPTKRYKATFIRLAKDADLGLTLRAWQGLTVSILVSAKLKLLGEQNDRFQPNGHKPTNVRAKGVKADKVEATDAGLMVFRGSTVELYPAPAHPVQLMHDIRRVCKTADVHVPSWLVPELASHLLDVVSFESGGAAGARYGGAVQLSAKKVERLLGKPTELRKYLRSVANRMADEEGRKRLRQIARRLPRGPRKSVSKSQKNQ